MKEQLRSIQQWLDGQLQALINRYPAKKLLVVSCVGMLVFGGLVGMLLGAGVLNGAFFDRVKLVVQVKTLEKTQRQNQLQLAELATLHDVDSQTLAEVSKTVALLESSLADAEIELQLHQTLMGEYLEADHPFVRKVQLFNSPRGEIAYRIIVQQGKALQGKASKVVLQATINGTSKKESIGYPLAQLDPSFPDGSSPFSIKYFRLFEGELLLPQDFVPQEIVIKTQVLGQKASSDEQIFAWRVESRL